MKPSLIQPRTLIQLLRDWRAALLVVGAVLLGTQLVRTQFSTQAFKTDDLVVTNSATVGTTLGVTGLTTVTGGITGLPITTCAAGTAEISTATDGSSTCQTFFQSGNFPVTNCPGGQAATSVANTGVLSCTAFGTSSLTNSAGANQIVKSDGTNLVASNIDDNGTTLSIPHSGTAVQITEATGVGVWTGAQTFNGGYDSHSGVGTVGQLRDTPIYPTALTGVTQNDYNPTGLATATIIYQDTNTGTTSITGLAGGFEGRRLTFCNIGTNTINFNPNNAGSTITNRFQSNWVNSLSGASPNNVACAELAYAASLGSVTPGRWVVTAINTALYGANFQINNGATLGVGTLNSTNANGFSLLQPAATATVPSFAPNRADSTSGIGGTSGAVSIITGGVERIRWTTSKRAFLDPATANQIISLATPTSVSHGSLSTNATDWTGTVTGVGAFTSVVLTFSSAFPNASRCQIQAISNSVVLESIIPDNDKTAPTFSCFSVLSGLAANCDDFNYSCIGQ